VIVCGFSITSPPRERDLPRPGAGGDAETPALELFAESVRTITKGQQTDTDVLSNGLVAIGYERASLVTRVGELSRRGGIIDLFSLHTSIPSAWSSSAIRSSPCGNSTWRRSARLPRSSRQ